MVAIVRVIVVVPLLQRLSRGVGSLLSRVHRSVATAFGELPLSLVLLHRKSAHSSIAAEPPPPNIASGDPCPAAVASSGVALVASVDAIAYWARCAAIGTSCVVFSASCCSVEAMFVVAAAAACCCLISRAVIFSS